MPGLGIGGSTIIRPSDARVLALAESAIRSPKRIAKPRTIMLRGDSTVIGYMTTYPAGNNGAQRFSPSRVLRDVLRSRGYAAQDEFWVGSGGYTSASGYAQFDPRLSFGAGWEYLPSTTAVFGVMRNNSTIDAAIAVPDTKCDTAIFVWSGTSGKGQGSITFGGQTKNFDQNQATPGWYSTIIGPADGISLAANSFSVKRTGGGNVTADAIWCYDSTVPSFRIVNAAASGMQAKNLANSGNPYSSLYFPSHVLTAGDMLIWQVGVNDWKDQGGNTPTDTALFQGYVEAVADDCAAHGIEMVVVGPVPSSTSGASLASQSTFRSILAAVANAKGLRYYDVADLWGSYADADAAGMMVGGSDYYHPNWYGALSLGNLYADIVTVPA